VAHESNATTSRRCAEERNAFVTLFDQFRISLRQTLRLLPYTVHVLLESCKSSSASQIWSDIVVKSNVQAELTIRREHPASSQHQAKSPHD